MKLESVSAFCSALSLSWLLPLLPAAAQAQDVAIVRSLAATCANCHGTNGVSRGEVASLAGAPAQATIAKMAAFKNGALPATVMHQIAKGYSDEQIRQLAAYFATVK